MTENNKFQISPNVQFPSQLDSFEQKKQKSWGMAVANAIYSQWFYQMNNTTCRFYTSQLEFFKRRNYAIGNVSMKQYYPKLGTNGDVSLLNLSSKPLTTIPKLVDLVVNGMCGRKASIRARAIDPISQKAFQSYRKNIEDDMNAKDVILKAKESFGVDIGVMPLDKLPENSDELNLHLQLEYKPSNCLSNELAIEAVMQENDYENCIDRKVKRDLVVDGIGITMNRFSPSKGIVLERIDPVNFIYSDTIDPYFRNCFYKGHVKEVLLSDIYTEYPDLNNAENTQVKQQINDSGLWWRTNYKLKNNGLKGTAYLLYFTYKTYREIANKIVESENGSIDVVPYTEEKNKRKDYRPFKKVTKVEEVLMEGCMVLGTNVLLKWEESKSMARPKSNKQKVVDMYNAVAPNMENGVITSLVSRMIPIEDLRNVIELKAEQIIQGITPDGIAIDLDALAEVDLGEGKSGVMDQFNMYLQKGSLFYRSSTMGGDYNSSQSPFKEIRTGDSINKLTALRNESNGYLIQLTDVIGLNKATDATNPDKDSLVGIQKLAALNSNQATRHILSGANYIQLKTGEAVSYRISDILKYYPSLREDLIRKIGATSVADLESVKDLHLSDFAIYLSVEMDDEERAMLNADLSMAIEKGYIRLDHKYKIMNIEVFDLAIAYLGVLIDKFTKQQQDQKAQEFKIQSDENIRASQASEGFKQQTIQMEIQAEQAKQSAIAQAEIAKENVRGEWNLKVEQLKGQNAMGVQQLANQGKVSAAEATEEGKKDNLAQNATYQADLIHQRETAKTPTDYAQERDEEKMFELENNE